MTPNLDQPEFMLLFGIYDLSVHRLCKWESKNHLVDLANVNPYDLRSYMNDSSIKS